MSNPIRYRMSHGAGQCLYAADNTGYVVAATPSMGLSKLRKYTGAPFRSPPGPNSGPRWERTRHPFGLRPAP